eukprot:2076034-Rhodomonas_salina.4
MAAPSPQRDASSTRHVIIATINRRIVTTNTSIVAINGRIVAINGRSGPLEKTDLAASTRISWQHRPAFQYRYEILRAAPNSILEIRGTGATYAFLVQRCSEISPPPVGSLLYHTGGGLISEHHGMRTGHATTQ